MKDRSPGPGFWQTRYTVFLMCFAATFICYIDRVNISVAILPMAEEFNWTETTQGLILSFFYVGYMLMQIVGGRLADRFGGKIVLGLGVLIWSIFTFLTPMAAWSGLALLLAVRIGMGLGEAVTFPSVYSLVSRWAPVHDKAKAIAFNASAIPIGTVFALITVPIIVGALGWEWAFYLFGAVGLVWFALWQYLVTTNPTDHPHIGAAEIAHIQENSSTLGATASAPPISQLLKNKPLWAIIVAHFCNNWTLYVILSWLPKYFNDGLGVPFASVGMVAMLPQVSSFFFLNMFGTVADRMIRNGMSVTYVRKLLQCGSFAGIAVCLFAIGFVSNVWVAVAILIVAKFFGAMSAGGFSVNHMDIGPRHAGTLMGITNTAGTIPGVVAVYATGWILETWDSWAMVFWLTASVSVVGMIVYAIFASGEEQFE